MSATLVGVDIATSDDWVGAAMTAESLGYDFVSASDHPAHTAYETWTMLTWVASRTSRIRLATRVLGVPFRLPAMVAKAAESLQRLSGGRLILGLGAGHDDQEIQALGGPLLSPRQKVDGLADAVRTIRGASQGEAPIWLGTYGPRALAVTGALADGWIPSLGHAPPRRIPEMLDRIRTASVAAGRAPGAVQAICNVSVRVDRTARRREHVMTGSAADVRDQLLELTELGFTGFNVMPESRHDVFAFANEVLPELTTA